HHRSTPLSSRFHSAIPDTVFVFRSVPTSPRSYYTTYARVRIYVHLRTRGQPDCGRSHRFARDAVSIPFLSRDPRDALGAAGTDTALETADVALLSDDLTKLPYFVALSRTATAVIERNAWGSLGMKTLLAIGVPFGSVSLIVAVVLGEIHRSVAALPESILSVGSQVFVDDPCRQ